MKVDNLKIQYSQTPAIITQKICRIFAISWNDLYNIDNPFTSDRTRNIN